tara:strand:- start:152 stop:400 length:249 start_codon:yes stop_codon:yes gene_type:complete
MFTFVNMVLLLILIYIIYNNLFKMRENMTVADDSNEYIKNMINTLFSEIYNYNNSQRFKMIDVNSPYYIEPPKPSIAEMKLI